ncbi:MAG: hypothetical protein LBK82_06450 [Planctomycetaceae bacterium]|nr:hypothetical protein [Planctomycetaceae bacterium]
MKNTVILGLLVSFVVFLYARTCSADTAFVDPQYCTVRTILGSTTNCNSTEVCKRILFSVQETLSNARKTYIDAPVCSNNCSDQQGVTASKSVSQSFTIGYIAQDLWQQSSNHSLHLGSSFGAGYERITTIGSVTGTSVSAQITVTRQVSVSAPPHTKLCGQYYVKLVDFEYRQNYEYRYTRTDQSNAPGCYCTQGSGFNCSNLLSNDGTVTATGTKITEEGTDTTTSEAEDCGS